MLRDDLERWVVGVGRRFKRQGTYAHVWLIHIVVQQKATQHCKAIILQLKINLKKHSPLKKNNEDSHGHMLAASKMGTYG